MKHLILLGTLLIVVGCSSTPSNRQATDNGSHEENHTSNLATPSERKEMFKNGEIRLRTERQGWNYGPKLGNFSKLHRARQWSNLADAVAKDGTNRDLEYYYLAISAEALGYYDASLTYYERAKESPRSCFHFTGPMGDFCYDFEPPDDIERGIRRVTEKIQKRTEANQWQTREFNIDLLKVVTRSLSDPAVCASGGIHKLTLIGTISPDSSFAMEKLLSRMSSCRDSSGKVLFPTTV